MKFLAWKAWSPPLQRLGLIVCMVWPVYAPADELRLQALTVPYDSPWQRATPQQEAEDEALLLDAPSIGLHVAVLPQARALKTDAEAYYAKLKRNWQALYGHDSKIFWLDTGGGGELGRAQKWLVCQRPARESGMNAFHLSTVFEGRSYSLLLFAAGDALPRQALDLLAKVRFAGLPVTGENAVNAANSLPGWRITQTLYPQASAGALESLVQGDSARLGEDGLVTGYGLEFGASGVTWFIEGFRWKTVAERVVREPWGQGGHLDWTFAKPSTDVVRATVRLNLVEGETDVGARLRVWDICAPTQRIGEMLAQLERGSYAPLLRLAAERPAGCPQTVATAMPPLVPGESGKTVQAELFVSLPTALSATQQAALLQAGLARIALVEIALLPGPRHTGFGDQLIERARGYAVFEMNR